MLRTTQSITKDLKCTQCGYNLRGLTPDKVCPECATPVTRSLDRKLLRYADPNWLNKLRRGSKLMLVFPIQFLLAGSPNPAGSLVSSIGACLALWVIFQVTTPEPSVALDDDPTTLRKFLRACAILSFLGFVVRFLGQSSWARVVLDFVVLISLLLLLAAYLGHLVYFRRLALRVPDLRLTRSTTIVMWGSVVTMVPFYLVGGGMDVVQSQGGPFQAIMESSPVLMVWLVAGMLLVPAIPVFWIWYGILLHRYHNAFQTAMAEAAATQPHGSILGSMAKDD